MSNTDAVIERYDQGESAWDETDEVVDVDVQPRLDKVIPVRLSADKWEALRREAKELGVGPTTLARMWLLERLKAPYGQPVAQQRG